jgi:hypothetical protein
MAVPESQLDTWAHQGAVAQSRDTYATIRRALESAKAAYSGQSYDIFLQGSYGNDTNIYAESDVDVVIRLDSCFYHNAADLAADQSAAFHAAHPGAASYNLTDFKRDVVARLRDEYKAAAAVGTKAVNIQASNNRRSADVIVAAEYRRYYRFNGRADQSHVTGLCFCASDGTKIINYPKQHSDNLTAKHQATNSWFKPTVRILKNLRGKLVDEGMIASDTAPSYYLEGLLYNVPNDRFGRSYADTIADSINWILNADRSKFINANEQYYLLRENSPVTWRDAKCTEFLNAACRLWNEW